jgi:hypothetical protein
MTRGDGHDGSLADDGIRTQMRAAKRGAVAVRRRSADRCDPAMLAAWPAERRALLAAWLQADAPTRRWDTLLQIAGPDRLALADDLCRALLAGGWIALDERRSPRRDWRPYALHWRDPGALRRALGLEDAEALAAERDTWRARPLADPRVAALAATLDGLPLKTALRRWPLLHRLDAWLGEARRGSRRQFAQFARGATKAVSEAEWAWLDEHLGLAELGIDAHQPGLWLRAPLRLRFDEGELDLCALREPLALTPASLLRLRGASGQVTCWRVLENRTSFEQAAVVYGDRDGVLWTPGFPGAWWADAVAALLRHAPAPAEIACDPDPAGIQIALRAGAVWANAGLPWRPWAMSASHLRSLAATRALNDYDRAALARLQHDPGLPPDLRALAEALLESGQKGEQEGLDLRSEG